MEKLVFKGGTKEEKSFKIVKKVDKNHFIVEGVRGWPCIMDFKGSVLTTKRYHKIVIEAGMLYGERGACKYILDQKTFQEISDGHHKLIKRGGKLYGIYGNCKTILDPKIGLVIR